MRADAGAVIVSSGAQVSAVSGMAGRRHEPLRFFSRHSTAGQHAATSTSTTTAAASPVRTTTCAAIIMGSFAEPGCLAGPHANARARDGSRLRARQSVPVGVDG